MPAKKSPHAKHCPHLVHAGAGFSSFIEVGEALSAIRERRLYRASHGTFENYCAEKWGMSRSNAYQIIVDAGTAKSVQDIGQTLNREQARALTEIGYNCNQ